MNHLAFDTTLLEQKSIIIVGLSGGPDSICLLHNLVAVRAQFNLTIIAAHLDHQWREDSHLDVALCQNFCETLGVPLVVGKASDFKMHVRSKGSMEDLGRQMRRLFFESLTQVHEGSVFIALAHHADDQSETFFMRIMRGTTLTGLCCMKKNDGLYIRPLLEVHKADIMVYIKHHALPFIVDSTNESQTFLRNKIRKQLLPLMQNIDQRSNDHILSLIDHLQKAEQFIEKETASQYLTVVKNGVLDVLIWKTCDTFMQKRIMLCWLYEHSVGHISVSAGFIDEIMRFLLSDRGGKHKVNLLWSLVKKQHKAMIVPKKSF